MRVRVQKWGNSLALRIPKTFARETNIREDAVVELGIEDGRLVISPASQHVYELAELLKGVRRSNLHREVDTGAAQGREVW